MKLKDILTFCLELFFPPHCIFCEKVIAPGTKVCKACADAILPIHSIRRMNLPDSGQNIPCIVLYPYEDLVRDSIIRFKFYGEKKNADFYADHLAELIAKQSKSATFDLVTAVPISTQRQKMRGYNQSELIARKVAGRLKLSFAQCLTKVQDNPEQHRLSRAERIQNVKGVYRAHEQIVANKNILLIDDIVTTGSTLCECACTLRKEGARTVVCAAVAQVS